MRLRPKPDDIDLLARMIEMRDTASLAGIRDDPFRLFEFNGSESVLFSPGKNEGINVSTVGMKRLEDLGLFHVIDYLPKGFTFDLVDDVRDRLEEMKVGLGQPSRMGELEAAVVRAEAATASAESSQREIEARAVTAARSRADLRAAFARRVGRWAQWVARITLGTIYVGVVVIAGYLVSANLPLALIVGIVGVAVALTALDWLLHIDGFTLAAGVETRVVRRVTAWLESFDPDA